MESNTKTLFGKPLTPGSEWVTRDGTRAWFLGVSTVRPLRPFVFELDQSIDGVPFYRRVRESGMAEEEMEHPLDIVAPAKQDSVTIQVYEFADGTFHVFHFPGRYQHDPFCPGHSKYHGRKTIKLSDLER